MDSFSILLLDSVNLFWREMGCPDTFDAVPMSALRSLPYSKKDYLDVLEVLRMKQAWGSYVSIGGMNIDQLLNLLCMYIRARYTYGTSFVGHSSIELGADGMISVSTPMLVDLNENGKEFKERWRALMQEIRSYSI
jgi:hypothetical protein